VTAKAGEILWVAAKVANDLILARLAEFGDYDCSLPFASIRLAHRLLDDLCSRHCGRPTQRYRHKANLRFSNSGLSAEFGRFAVIYST
jgi:hypothetical protein